MSYLENSRVEYAFAISGIAAACLSIVFYILQVVESKALKQIQNETGSIKSNGYFENDNTIEVNGESNKSYLNILRGYDWRNKLRGLLQMFNPAACAKGRFWYGSSILFVVFFYFGNAGGGQGFTSKFLRSFSIDQLDFTNTDASLLNTSFWISFSTGRFIFFIIARMVSVKLLLLLETSTLMVFAIFLAIFGCDNSTALCVLTQVVAFCIGPLWPTGIAWTDYHIELTGNAMALQMVGCAFGYMLHMRLIGYLYDSFGPHTYVLHVAGSAILGFILTVVLAIIGAKHGNRFVPENISDTDGGNDIDFSEKENEKGFTKTDVTTL
ncbi:uncharacterized protein LOC132738143 [Ruditapes philippinarum]|uniref:uncharacterized protein LOC132738143 n=1 Tax=Ruditapes philippinarum TaxID=129788 RepID=UPI00295AA7F6|nr:uncharacterized protein LOC132738143 [Ruditapes philippinarum]